jgi:hypothetical protein
VPVSSLRKVRMDVPLRVRANGRSSAPARRRDFRSFPRACRC